MDRLGAHCDIIWAMADVGNSEELCAVCRLYRVKIEVKYPPAIWNKVEEAGNGGPVDGFGRHQKHQQVLLQVEGKVSFSIAAHQTAGEKEKLNQLKDGNKGDGALQRILLMDTSTPI